MSEELIHELGEDTVYLLRLFHRGALEIQERGDDMAAEVAVTYMKSLSKAELIGVIADMSGLLWSSYVSVVNDPGFDFLNEVAHGRV